MVWRLAEAKNRFSEVFNRALAEGPSGCCGDATL